MTGFSLVASPYGDKNFMKNLLQFSTKYKLHENNFCTYVTDRKDKILFIYLKPDGQEIDCSKLNVKIHQNGLEF